MLKDLTKLRRGLPFRELLSFGSRSVEEDFTKLVEIRRLSVADRSDKDPGEEGE